MKDETVVFGYKGEDDCFGTLLFSGRVLGEAGRAQIKQLAKRDGFTKLQFEEYNDSTTAPDFVSAITS